MEVSPSQERRFAPVAQDIEPIGAPSPRRAGTRVGLVATMPRSGTWYNNLFFHYYMQLLEGKEDLSVIDIMCFGTALKEPYKRFKRDRDDIMNWNQFDMTHYMDDNALEDWILNKRKKVMYRDEKNVD